MEKYYQDVIHITKKNTQQQQLYDYKIDYCKIR